LPRVLVIDDEPPLRLLYRVNLEAEGMEVGEAADGLSGIATAKRESPDIILLDVMMPRLDGWGVAEQLRDDPVTRDIPFVFVTARSRFRDRLRGFCLGAADYITLPVNPLELAPRIREVLARTRDELDAVRRERIVEVRRWIQREDNARTRLRELIEQQASEIFGSGVQKTWDAREMHMLHLWLEDGSEWRITVEPTTPPKC
jgi:DNA-binding response OmpR family regulator